MKLVTDVNVVNQLLTYSKQAETTMHQNAIQILLGQGQDSLSISDIARSFSKELNDPPKIVYRSTSVQAFKCIADILGMSMDELYEACQNFEVASESNET